MRWSRYWDWPDPAGSIACTAPAEEFLALLHNSVRLRRVAEVPRGIAAQWRHGFLSSIAALAGLDGAGDTLPAFVATFPGDVRDESLYASAAAHHAGIPLTKVPGDPADLDAELDVAVRHLQSPASMGQIVSRNRLLGAVARAGR